MSNGLVKHLAREKGIDIEEAKNICKERKKYRKYFKEVNENENYRKERSEGKNTYKI